MPDTTEPASPLKIAIVGAGAVGGLIAAKLENAGIATALLARGAHLRAIREHGLTLLEQEQRSVCHPVASDSAAELGVQDIVFICLKGPALFSSAAALQGLIGPQTVIVPAMNGVPWWFTTGLDGPYGGTWLKSTDPARELSSLLPPSQVLGCVVHLASSLPEAGTVRRGMGNRLIVGEPDGQPSARLAHVAGLLERAGFDVTASTSIRQEIWAKLWGNMNMNPISALTLSTADLILDDPLTYQLVLSMMEEARALGAQLGMALPADARERVAVTRKLGAFKTSMLQDLEGGRPMEIDAILAVGHELGQVTGVPTPFIDAVLGLVRLRARQAGLYQYRIDA